MLVAQGVVVRPRHNNLRALCLQNRRQPPRDVEVQPLLRRAAHPPDRAAVIAAVPRIQRDHAARKHAPLLRPRRFALPRLRVKGLHGVFPRAGQQQRRAKRAGRKPRALHRPLPHRPSSSPFPEPELCPPRPKDDTLPP